MGNQISAVLILTLPFIIYSVIKENKKRNILVLVVNSLGLMLLGTRVSVLGTVIVYVYTICGVVIFNKFIYKKKLQWREMTPIAIVLLIYLALMPFNPAFGRIYEMENLIEPIVVTHNQEEVYEEAIYSEYVADEGDEGIVNGSIEILETEDSELERVRILNYIYENYLWTVPEQFVLHSYPYRYDPEFWLRIMREDVSVRTNHRYVQRAMVRRVIEINDNEWDKFFGITNTRLQNIFNIEQDFIVQYYALRNNRSNFDIFSVFCIDYVCCIYDYKT
ncbi:MAG: O-antigen ligase family protein [Oscillospiraceae bacterium]|nr:O-antigen ligase family protein [Oscillospiraceae bacterium]